MANAAARMFASVLDSKQMHYSYVNDEESAIRVGWNLDNTKIAIFFKFADDCSNVHIWGRDFLSFSKDKTEKMYKLCNDANEEYRWAKFIVKADDLEVQVEDDAVIQLDSCGEECFELMIRMAQITDEVYPKFMKNMWG